MPVRIWSSGMLGLIMMLLSIALFGDKNTARVHLRWLQYLSTSDEKLPRVEADRRQLDRLTNREFVWLPYRSDAVEAAVHPSIWHPNHRVDRVIPQFEEMQNITHAPLNIDFLHAKDGHGIDRWYPTTYRQGLWATRFAQTFEVTQVDDPGPSADLLRWWFLAGKRYLVAEDAFHQLPPNEIPMEATQRQRALGVRNLFKQRIHDTPTSESDQVVPREWVIVPNEEKGINQYFQCVIL
ncbi:hypothetical protein PIB30_060702 [Stylosanthes scabra]|uniref:Uncharacterized protein n=1 Tax=Stylosanthes scabra TaxID=79078 RepID=A0ABU6TL89_9FABA|nr:hypothetical protein [Stylosanthes scabra]